MNTIQKEDWHLVQYIEDGVWEICPNKHIKFSKGRCLAKWTDRRWYPANIFSSGDKDALYELKNKKIEDEFSQEQGDKSEDEFLQKQKDNSEDEILQVQKGESEGDISSGDESEYVPEESSHESSKLSETSELSESPETNIFASSLNASVGLDVTIPNIGCGSLLKNQEEVIVDSSDCGSKSYACPFCEKLVKKLPRHIEAVHQDNPEVKKISSIPKNRMERKQLLSSLRKQGRYNFNLKASVNDKFQVARRPGKNRPSKTASKFTPCPNCKEILNKTFLRQHFSKCSGRSGKHTHSTHPLSRRIFMDIHERATNDLKRVISVMRWDDVCAIVRYDLLLILFGNQQCMKYRHSRHLDKMIRGKLRLLGNFLITIKGMDKNIQQLSDIFDSMHYESFQKAVNVMGKYNTEKDLYDTPANASMLGTLVQELAKIWDDECTISRNTEGLQRLEFFRKLFSSIFNSFVSKTVSESQEEMKRTKKVVLPEKSDIRRLHVFLCDRRSEAFNKLKNGYDFTTWRILLETTLLSIQVFNRRRAGEIERLKLEHYKNREVIDESTNIDLYGKLSKNAKGLVNKYSRILLRGKKNRTVPVLVDKDMVDCLNTIIQYRADARVHTRNNYLFGLPGNDKEIERWANACKLMEKYSELCGARVPKTLRGTLLRKHVATVCMALNLSNNEVEDLANFMGHEKEIHLRHYRQPVAHRDILQVSCLLEKAQGIFDENNKISEETDEEEGDEEGNFSQSDYDNENRNITRDHSSGVYSDSSPIERFVKKQPWGQDSVDAVMDVFKEEITNNKSIISGKKINDLISSTPCLKSRTPAQIRAFIHNKRKTISQHDICKISQKKRNTVPSAIYTFFEKNIENKTLPSVEECVGAYNCSPSLKTYSPMDIQNFIKKAIDLHNTSL